MTLSDPRVVVIGGGTGCPAVLEGLRSYTSRLTAIVTVMDSGGSSGRLRRELGIPSLGDLRRCLVALADHSPGTLALADLVEYRFEGEGALAGHSLGNLLLVALMRQSGGLEAGVQRMAQLLSARGTVLPVTLQSVELCAVLRDGTVLEGEAAIDRRGASTVGVERIYLKPEAEANPKAVEAIREAQVIVLGPGDLYTSVLPNLLVRGIAEAICAAPGRKVFIGNLVTKPGETEGYKLSDFLLEALRYLGLKQPLDVVVANAELAGGSPVEIDAEACRDLARRILVRPVAGEDDPWRHHPDRTAQAILEGVV